MRILSGLLVASSLFGLSLGSARAQSFNPNLIGGVMSPVVLDPCPAGLPCGAHRAGASPSRAGRTTHGPVTTSYRPDPAVTAKARRNFIASVSRQAGDVAGRAVEKGYAREDPLRTWARATAPDGMRLGDAADAMAEYWVLTWQMANTSDHTTPAQVQGVRRQVVAAMAASPGFVALGPAGRQALAEVLIYNTLFQNDVYVSLRRSGEMSRLKVMSDGAVSRFRDEAHLDLRSLDLTDQGLTPRR